MQKPKKAFEKIRAAHMRERCTFKPTLIAASSSSNNQSVADDDGQERAANAAARLYESGVKLHKKRNEVARNPNAHGHSFKPTLIASNDATAYGYSSLSRLSGQARLDRMHDAAAVAAKKKQIAMEEQLACHKFAPTITLKGKNANAPSLVDRFIHAPSPQKQHRQREKKKKEHLHANGVTFSPQFFTKKMRKKSTISPSGKKNNKIQKRFKSRLDEKEFCTRMHARAAEYAAEMEQAKEELEHEKMMGVSFTPQLATRKSGGKKTKSAHRKQKTCERLYQVAAEYKKSKELARENLAEEEMEDVTFTPDLSATMGKKHVKEWHPEKGKAKAATFARPKDAQCIPTY